MKKRRSPFDEIMKQSRRRQRRRATPERRETAFRLLCQVDDLVDECPALRSHVFAQLVLRMQLDHGCHVIGWCATCNRRDRRLAADRDKQICVDCSRSERDALAEVGP
ncbi:MAG: hypothetical protein ACF8XB_19155 [Planctomycetota bacterium JB042]